MIKYELNRGDEKKQPRETSKHLEAFEVWYGEGRNFTECSNKLTISRVSLYSWAEKFNWHQRAANFEDMDGYTPAVGSSWLGFSLHSQTTVSAYAFPVTLYPKEAERL